MRANHPPLLLHPDFLIMSNDDWYTRILAPFERTNEIHVSWSIFKVRARSLGHLRAKGFSQAYPQFHPTPFRAV